MFFNVHAGHNPDGIFTYSASSKANNYAKNICNEIAHFGLENRGIKHNKNLYFLKNTKSPAILIEVAFVDDRDDVNTYLKNIDNIANAIVKGILGKTTDHPGEPSTAAGLSSIYDYKLVFDPAYYANKYPDLKSVLGTDAPKLFHHFKSYGMKEGRQGISTFNVIAYKNRYADLRKAFGNNLELYYNHYITCGYKENRIGT